MIYNKKNNNWKHETSIIKSNKIIDNIKFKQEFGSLNIV